MLLRSRIFINSIFMIICYSFIVLNTGMAVETHIDQFMPASTPNTSGSGGRAHGMNGAFISVADDGTASYWNVACLDNLLKKEFSIVTNLSHRIEKMKFDYKRTGNGPQTISILNLNHMSYSYPFFGKLFYFLPEAHHVFSINYQQQYDFTKKWNFSRMLHVENIKYTDAIDYQSEGKLSTIGLAYSVLIRENISFGVVFNIWDNDITHNKWEQTNYQERKQGNTLREKALLKELNEFKGYNANFGLLFRNIFKNNGLYKVNMGVVLKTPFHAKIDKTKSFVSSTTEHSIITEKHTLKMPVSYGLGTALVSNDFNCALDIYRTEWNGFFDTDPTLVVRLGYEYLHKKGHYVLPFRCGFSYDPSPAEGTIDKFWNISIGSGVELINHFSFDIAYQFRFANNVNGSILKSMNFSQDIREHTLYSSLILYFN